MNGWACLAIPCTSNCLELLQNVLIVRFLSPNNQRVTDALIDQVYNDCNGVYNVKDIKRKS